MKSPRFSLLSLILIVTAISMGISLFLSYRNNVGLEKALNESRGHISRLKTELGWIEHQGDGRLYIRQLESYFPIGRKYFVDFPPGDYRVVAGDYLGGDFEKANIRRQHHFEFRFERPLTLAIQLAQDNDRAVFYAMFIEQPDAEFPFLVNHSMGGAVLNHKIHIEKITRDQGGFKQALKWRKGMRPHGAVKTYSPDTKFIPLFLVEDGVWLDDQKGDRDYNNKGIAFWIEPVGSQ